MRLLIWCVKVTTATRHYVNDVPASLAAGSFAAGSFAAGSFAAGSLAAGSFAAGSFAAGSFAAGSLAAGSLCIFRPSLHVTDLTRSANPSPPHLPSPPPKNSFYEPGCR